MFICANTVYHDKQQKAKGQREQKLKCNGNFKTVAFQYDISWLGRELKETAYIPARIGKFQKKGLIPRTEVSSIAKSCPLPSSD